MAKTLLNAVNETLKRLKMIQGDADILTTLTDSSRQIWIDIAVQVVNEGIDTLYDSSGVAQPNELSETVAEITLVLNQREYTLPTDVVQLRFPGLNEVAGLFIDRYPGGYAQMRLDQPTPDTGYEGLPTFAAINPSNGKLRMDHRPQADDVGDVYIFEYDKDLVLTLAADTVPFTDAAFRAMVPAWAQLVSRDLKRDFDAAIFERQIGQAARFLTQEQRRDRWS